MGIDRTQQIDKTPLLMDAEQNIGNSAIVMPQVGPGGPSVETATTIPQTNPQRLIKLSGGSAVGQTTSVVVTASRIVGAQNPNPGYPGPITGIVEFGNGGRFTRAEFDIPSGPFVGQVQAAAEASEPQDGGVIITVPTGVLRVYARYDNLLIAPVLGIPPQGLVCLADIQGISRMGPGGAVVFPIAPPNVAPAEPVLVKAMASYFSRHHARVYKTLYCYISPTGAPGPTALVSSAPAPALQPVYYCLPAFARTLKVLRYPITTDFTVELHDGVNTVDEFSLVSGTSAPIVPLVGHETIVKIQSKTAADRVYLLALCCEVGF